MGKFDVPFFSWGAHYMVDGVRYKTLKDLAQASRAHGYYGTLSTLRERVCRGMNTWAQLSAPVRKDVGRAADMRDRRRAKLAEGAAIAAALDKRKAEIAALAAKTEDRSDTE